MARTGSHYHGSKGPFHLPYANQRSKRANVMAIPGCQLDDIWNELQSKIGRLTCDPNLEVGRYKFLTWILAWES
jgi:hypothetical protein